jgi:hypothetical protein
MNRAKILVEGDSETICEDVLTSVNLHEKWYAYELDKVENLRNILLGIPELEFEEEDIWGGPGQSYTYTKVLYRSKRRIRDQISSVIDEAIKSNGLVKRKSDAQDKLVVEKSVARKSSIAPKSDLDHEQEVLDLLKPIDLSPYLIQTNNLQERRDLKSLVEGKNFIARIADWNSSPSVWTFFYCIEDADGTQTLVQVRKSGNMVGGNVRRLSIKETSYSPVIKFRADERVSRRILAQEIFRAERPRKVDMSFLGSDLEPAFNSLRTQTNLQL